MDSVHSYDVTLGWEGDRHGALTAGDRSSVTVGPPPDFDGKDSWWSPEHLLLSATTACIMTTFFALAAREKLEVDAFRATGHATLEKTTMGFVFTSIKVDVTMRTKAADTERAAATLAKAKRHCIISNALKTPVELNVDISPA
jgi:organic hydroperoxide reductase OsmC/OhrA